MSSWKLPFRSGGTQRVLSRYPVRALSGLLLSAVTAGCGSDGDGGTTPPPPPPAVASVDVTPATHSMLVGETVQLSATPRDASGNALTGRTVSWTSDDNAVATVDASGLVTGVGAGPTTVSATSEGQTGTSSVQVDLGAFAPTEDTELIGTHDFSEVNVPAGVTVTLTGDVTLDVEGSVTVDGTMSGECVAVTVNGGATVDIGGTIANGCTGEQQDLPAMTIIGNGETDIDGATFVIAGDFKLANDPDLDDTDFPDEGAAVVRAPGSRRQTFIGVRNTSFRADPIQADPGTDGQNGTGGKDAKTWRLQAYGTLILGGNVLVEGQSGGHGGEGEHSDPNSAAATGGDGGKGGLIKVQATEDIIFGGTNNVVASGFGGNGGGATASGMENVTPDKAASADARGGKGAAPGLVEIRALLGIQVGTDALTLDIGDAGAGGFAIAIGADGVNADERPGVAQAGGDGTAVGGEGGTTPDKKFRASGDVTGAGDVELVGGDAGPGGNVWVEAGDGGEGNLELEPDGAAGGNATGTAGKGGNDELRDLDGNLGRPGGNGGILDFGDSFFGLSSGGGNGGDGWPDCVLPEPFKRGGNGGKGGVGTGTVGKGGTGLVPGQDGPVNLVGDAFNGGNGRDGLPPGAAGEKGTDAIPQLRDETGTNFQPGAPGNPCAVRTPRTTVLQLNQIPNTGGVVPSGTHVVDIVDLELEGPIGTIPLTTMGLPNNHFFGANPDRIGVNGGNGHGWRIDVGDADVPHDVEVEIVQLELCSVNPINIGPGNPLQIVQVDLNMNQVSMTSVTDPNAPGGIHNMPGCNSVPLDPAAAFVQLQLGSGTQIDFLPPELIINALPPPG